MNRQAFRLQAIRVPPNGEWSNGTHSWCLLLLQHGGAAYQWDSVAHELKPGDGLLLPAGVPGRLRTGAHDEAAGCYFHFSPEHLSGVLTLEERLLFQEAASQPNCVRRLSADSQLTLRLDTMAGLEAPKDTLEQRCELLRLMAPLISELRKAVENNRHAAGEASSRMNGLLVQITEADLLELSVEELARRCGCTRRHLSRLVHERFGCSLVSLKNQIRLERAAILLQDPGAKTVNVAMECGFNHLGTFTAKFKQRFGATPAKWREALLHKYHPTMAEKFEKVRPEPVSKSKSPAGKTHATD